jgi:hypothetical protein
MLKCGIWWVDLVMPHSGTVYDVVSVVSWFGFIKSG